MAGDIKTKEAMVEIMITGCPLKTVLVKKKPCPYAGSSGNCSDCTYSWLVTADEVLEVANARRASYEREYQKSKELKRERDEAVEKVETIINSWRVMSLGMESLRKLDSFMDEIMERKEEVKDEKLRCEPEDQEGLQGGEDSEAD